MPRLHSVRRLTDLTSLLRTKNSHHRLRAITHRSIPKPAQLHTCLIPGPAPREAISPHSNPRKEAQLIPSLAVTSRGPGNDIHRTGLVMAHTLVGLARWEDLSVRETAQVDRVVRDHKIGVLWAEGVDRPGTEESGCRRVKLTMYASVMWNRSTSSTASCIRMPSD